MTSWIRATGAAGGARKPAPLEKSYTFETSDAPFPSQAVALLYARMFSQKEGAALYIADEINYVRANFPLFRSAYSDISGVRYTDSKILGSTTLSPANQRFAQYVGGLTLAQVRPVAKEALVLHEAAMREIQGVLESTHLLVLNRGAGAAAAGASKTIPFLHSSPDIMMAVSGRAERRATGPSSVASSYVAALRAAAAQEKLEGPKILLYAEDYEFAQEIVKGADPRWTFYLFPLMGASSSSKAARRSAFFEELARLAVLQSSLNLVCERSTPLGQFLLATTAAAENGVLQLV